MPTLNTPGGSTFPYFYKNGELLGLHYGSFHEDEEGLVVYMKAEEEFILGQHHPLPLWIDFYETKLTSRVMTEFLQHILRMSSRIPRLALVGCSFKDKWRFERLGKKLGIKLPMPLRYFSDPEVAKTWLVSEGA